MARSKSSRRWLERQSKDIFTRKAREEGYRSRAVYKLLEIQERDRILRPGDIVVDLGSAPGGWAQVALQRVGATGRVVAVDILPMEPLAGAEVIVGDFTDEAVLEGLLDTLGNHPVDLVMSDMAPNTTGIPAVDQPRAMYLAELALDLARRVLRPGGVFLLKAFQGQGFDELVRELRTHFRQVKTRKPRASRDESRELYLLARDYNG